MPIQKLDADFARLATCPQGKKKIDYYDTSITGFVLEVRQSGGKTYYLRYENAGERQCQLKIASYGDLTFAKAKKAAERLRAEVVGQNDPMAQRREKRSVPVYATLAEQHLDYAKTYQKNPANTERIIRLHILPRWGKLRLDEITQPSIAKWLAEKLGEGLAPATVEKVRVMFNRSFELALRWETPGVSKNPVKGIPRKPINNARERFLSAAEAKRLMTAVEASLNPQLKHIVGLLLLTGARVSELLHAEWRHIDLEKRQWLIPTSKTGRARHVPLSKPAIDMLNAVPKFIEVGRREALIE